MSGFIVQKIEKKCMTDIERAVRYYSVLFCLNSIQLSIKEIEMLAFTAAKGTITYHKEEFIDMFSSSSASLENIKTKLFKRGFLVKDEGKIKVNPVLKMDFNEDIIIQIKLFGNHDRIEIKSEDRVGEVEVEVV